jgi:hypothetical protein
MNERLYHRVNEVCKLVECPPYEWHVTTCSGDCVFIQAKLYRKDSDTQEWGYGYSAKYWIDPDWSNDVIAKRCFVAAASFAEHEVREAWTYKGARVLGPHIPLDDLAELLNTNCSSIQVH